MGDQLAVSTKVEHMQTLWPESSIPSNMPNKVCGHGHQNTYVKVFAALLVIAKSCKQAQVSIKSRMMNKIRYNHTMKYTEMKMNRLQLIG